MLYTTLYDVRAEPYDWFPVVVCVALIVTGVCLVASGWNRPPTFQSRWGPIGWLGVALLFSAYGLGGNYYLYATHVAALREGTAEVVEGPVRDFRTQSDCKKESFSVGGATFEYAYSEDLHRFHFPQPCDGPIKPGMNVRITYIDGDILKLERRMPTPQPPPLSSRA